MAEVMERGLRFQSPLDATLFFWISVTLGLERNPAFPFVSSTYLLQKGGVGWAVLRL